MELASGLELQPLDALEYPLVSLAPPSPSIRGNEARITPTIIQPCTRMETLDLRVVSRLPWVRFDGPGVLSERSGVGPVSAASNSKSC